MRAFVDTSFFKALIHDQDEFHSKSLSIWDNLKSEKASLVTTNYILDETFTLIRVRCGLKILQDFRDYLTAGSEYLKVIRVTVNDEGAAWEFFTKDWSGLSYTDGVSFAVMKRLGISLVATFDNHFQKAGFKILK